METMCPGQDTRYWQPGDVFEVECGECGYEVEFFKDDAQRRCPRCGTRVSNPKLNLGCAQWCEHAKECLGYDPKERPDQSGSEQEALTDRLLEALKTELKGDRKSFARAVETLNRAHQLLSEKGGNPKVALSAALLVNLGRENGDSGRAKRIMNQAGLDKYTQEEALRIITDFRSHNKNGSAEYEVVAQAAGPAGSKAEA